MSAEAVVRLLAVQDDGGHIFARVYMVNSPQGIRLLRGDGRSKRGSQGLPPQVTLVYRKHTHVTSTQTKGMT